jgi:hypothetical protein
LQAEAFCEHGNNVHSADLARGLDLNGMTTLKAKKNIIFNLAKLNAGQEKVRFTLFGCEFTSSNHTEGQQEHHLHPRETQRRPGEGVNSPCLGAVHLVCV